MNSEPGALNTGSDPSYNHRARTMAGDMWRALATRIMKNCCERTRLKQVAARAQKIDENNSRSVSNGKIY